MIYAVLLLAFGFLSTVYAFWKGRHKNMEAAAICFLALVANTSAQSLSGDLMPLWWFIGIDTSAGLTLLLLSDRRWEVMLALLFLASVVAHVVAMIGSLPPRPYLDFVNALVYLQFATIIWGVRRDVRKYGPLYESDRHRDSPDAPDRSGHRKMERDG